MPRSRKSRSPIAGLRRTHFTHDRALFCYHFKHIKEAHTNARPNKVYIGQGYVSFFTMRSSLLNSKPTARCCGSYEFNCGPGSIM